MIFGSMRLHFLRPPGRILWIALLLCAGLLPAMHAAHHLDSMTCCTVCHFARGGVPALLPNSIALERPVVAVPAPAPTDDVQPEGPSGLREIIRGPPASSLA